MYHTLRPKADRSFDKDEWPSGLCLDVAEYIVNEAYDVCKAKEQVLVAAVSTG